MSAKRTSESGARVAIVSHIERPGTHPCVRVSGRSGSRSHTTRIQLLALAALVVAGGGCLSTSGQHAEDGQASRATSRPATTQQSSISIAPVPPTLAVARPVVQGPLPLIYLVENDGMLRVRNVQSGEEIITFPAKATQIVRVDTAGVFLASKPVIGANLLPGDYSIEIVPAGEGGIRSTQERNVLQTQ